MLATRLAPALLVVLLAVATLLPLDDVLRLESGDDSLADRWSEALDGLPSSPDILVGFDPDLGTYAEIRSTVRVLLADLIERRAGLAFVSLTPEGRALALAEMDRLDRADASRQQIADLGFLPGAEAALVQLTRDVPDPRDDTALGRRIAEAGLAEIDAIVIVGGNDFGPRSWVEQVAPRIGAVPLLGVAPTILLPELAPYTATGQLDALIATPRDGALYRGATALDTGARYAPPEGPSLAALLLGTAIAVLVLGQAVVGGLPRPTAGERGR